MIGTITREPGRPRRRDDGRDRRPGHAPDRDRAHPADDDAQGVDATVYYDPAKIWERFGLRPDQMIDYKALKGDPTDNIPGIPGVGEKTAAKLVGAVRFARRDLRAARRGQAGQAAREAREAREQVFASRELAD